MDTTICCKNTIYMQYFQINLWFNDFLFHNSDFYLRVDMYIAMQLWGSRVNLDIKLVWD